MAERAEYRCPFDDPVGGNESVSDEGVLGEELFDGLGGVGVDDDECAGVVGVGAGDDHGLLFDEVGEPVSMCGAVFIAACSGDGGVGVLDDEEVYVLAFSVSGCR